MLLGYHYGSVEDIELLWTIIAFVGLVFSLINFADAYKDCKYLAARGITNGRILVAKTNLWTEGMRGAIQTIFLVIGVLALMIESPPQTKLTTAQFLIGIVIRWGIITASLLLTIKTYLVRHLRTVLAEGNNGH